MTRDELKVAIELERIFMPLAYKKREKIRQEGGRFVHYTSAENAVNIIRSKSIWMRNARSMNDYMELYYGHEKLCRIFGTSELKEKFLAALSPFGDDMGNKVPNLFDQWWKNIQFNTYICSISVHDDSEDVHGRLSMWRAYGGNSAKAAIVIRLPLSPDAAEGLQLLGSPVEYFSYEQLVQEFLTAIDSITENAAYLAALDHDRILNMAFYMLVLAALCLKHEGFKEEKEWRIICLPYARPSANLDKRVEIIGGVPQTVYKIPLVDKPESNITGLTIPDLFDRLIIGPSVYPMPIHEAFVSLLAEEGMQYAADRVVISNIPLRT
jgi:Protein of unknown function (DUF2971)